MVREMVGYRQEYQGPKGHLRFADRAWRNWLARFPRLVEMLSRTYFRGGLSTGNSIFAGKRLQQVISSRNKLLYQRISLTGREYLIIESLNAPTIGSSAVIPMIIERSQFMTDEITY